MLKVFIGYDSRQPLAFNVAAFSVLRTASVPVAITALRADTLPIKRFGLTEFTFSRFLVPWLCGYQGDAVFMDSDVLVRSDIKELFDIGARQGSIDIAVMQEQDKFEWPSVMYFNCASHGCTKLTPDYVNDKEHNPLGLSWATSLGKLPPEWNHCIGYAEPALLEHAKLLHYTEGIPCWAETMGTGGDAAWQSARNNMLHTVDWAALMSRSVHAKQTILRFLKQRGMLN